MLNSLLFVNLFLVRFTDSHVVEAAKPFNQTCIDLGYACDCRFYTCFEERFPCGSSYWISKWALKYCERARNFSSKFDFNGQELFKRVNKCLINKLIKQRFYTLSSVDCEELRLAGQRMVHSCYVNNAKLFCMAFHGKSRDCFMKFIDGEDRHDFSLIRTLSNVGQRCTPKIKLADLRSSSKGNQCVLSAA